MWYQTFLREKRSEGISAEALTCSQSRQVLLLLLPRRALPAGRRCQGEPRAGQHLPLTAFPSPRTTWLLLPSSPAAKHRLRAPQRPGSHSRLPLGRGARCDEGWSSPGEQVKTHRFSQFAQLVLLSAPHWGGDWAESCEAAVNSGRCLQWLHPGWVSSHQCLGRGTCTSSPSPEALADASHAFGPSLLRRGTREPSRTPGGDSDSGFTIFKEQKHISKMKNSIHWSYFGNVEWSPQ